MLLKYFVLIILIFFYSLSSNGNSNIIEELKKNNKLIFIRHALAPGNGDPDNFDINGDVEGMYSLNQVTEDNLWSVERLEKLHPFEPRIIID